MVMSDVLVGLDQTSAEIESFDGGTSCQESIEGRAHQPPTEKENVCIFRYVKRNLYVYLHYIHESIHTLNKK